MDHKHVPGVASGNDKLADDKNESRTWYPPLRLGRFYLLMLLTASTYVFFWTYRTARDVKRHHDSNVTPWAYPFAVVISIAAAIAGGRQANQLRRMAKTENKMDLCDGTLLGLLIFVLLVTISIMERVSIPGYYFYFVIPLVPIPWLVMQRQANLIKSRVDDADWVSKPNKYTKLQIVAMLLFAPVWALIIHSDLSLFSGDALLPGEVVASNDGLFTVTIPSKEWRKVPSGTVGDDDSELELYGADALTFTVAYVDTDRTLYDIVSSRRIAVEESVSGFEFSEKRELVPHTNFPVSYATYRGSSLGSMDYYWITTIELDDRVIELLVTTSARPELERQAWALGRSIKFQ